MKIDCIDWHTDGEFPEDLEYKNGGTHIGMFISWLIINDLVSDSMKEDFSDEIELVLTRQMTGLELLLIADGKLSEDDISEDAFSFVDAYYNGNLDFPRSYKKDYETTLVKNSPSFYHVADSWENYSLLESFIDQSYKIWVAN